MYDETASKPVALDRTEIPGYLEFSVSVTVTEDSAVVRVAGDLDCYAAPQLRAVLCALGDEAPQRVVLDVGETNFIDSTGLGVLVGAAKRLRQGRGDLVVRSPTPATRRLFEITGVTKLFEFV